MTVSRPKKKIRSRRPSKRHSFKHAAGSFKLKQILKDIEDAKQLGIHLYNDISLNEMYSMLTHARQQLKAHNSSRGRFKFDDMGDAQPYGDDGLDELTHKVRQQFKRSRK